jgi:hypothetical protein
VKENGKHRQLRASQLLCCAAKCGVLPATIATDLVVSFSVLLELTPSASPGAEYWAAMQVLIISSTLGLV